MTTQIKGFASLAASSPQPRGIKVSRPGMSVTGAANIKSPFGKKATLDKIK
jgi:hypothetical protein